MKKSWKYEENITNDKKYAPVRHEEVKPWCYWSWTILYVSMIREAILLEKCSFFKIVQKAFDPPFEHYVVNFSEGILTKVRKRLLQQLSTK